MAAVSKASAKRKKRPRPEVPRSRAIRDTTPSVPEPSPARLATGTLLISSWLVLAECVALAGILVYLIYASITDTDANLKQAILVTLYAALFVGAFGLIGWGLRHRKSWSRGPAIALHLLLVPLGWYMIAGHAAGLGAIALALGIGGSILLLLPRTGAQLPPRR